MSTRPHPGAAPDQRGRPDSRRGDFRPGRCGPGPLPGALGVGTRWSEGVARPHRRTEDPDGRRRRAAGAPLQEGVGTMTSLQPVGQQSVASPVNSGVVGADREGSAPSRSGRPAAPDRRGRARARKAVAT